MPKIPVDSRNVIELKKEARLFCDIANKFFGIPVKTGDILSGLSKKLGYTSFGDMVACNKEERNYVPITLTDISHFRYLVSEISKQTSVSEFCLLSVASLMQLGAKSVDQIQFTSNVDRKVDRDDFTCLHICIDEDEICRENPLILPLSTQYSLLAARAATTLENIQFWLPELASTCIESLGATRKSLIHTRTNVLWGIVDSMPLTEPKLIGYLEIIVLNPNKKVPQRLYSAIFSHSSTINEIYEEVNSVLSHIPDHVVEGVLPSAELDEEVWFKQLVLNLEQEDIPIKLSVKIYQDFALEHPEFGEPDPLVIKFLTQIEYTASMKTVPNPTELRLVRNERYLEPWINVEHSKMLIGLDKKIQKQRRIICDKLMPVEKNIAEFWMQYCHLNY